MSVAGGQYGYCHRTFQDPYVVDEVTTPFLRAAGDRLYLNCNAEWATSIRIKIFSEDYAVYSFTLCGLKVFGAPSDTQSFTQQPSSENWTIFEHAGDLFGTCLRPYNMFR